ncbi:hypothetical protein ACETAC_01355 [Aceticella autotrophica]|uniref:Uncharacterized protein n=1 Tax=Aceticella autotrophica TaxID=2755338 RepID=A0A975AWC1_9THEO|nr:hypothetical protein [Aceticella autotrophica]QSZ27591.1 hypothetical protein ACETAC_01355 [Aceticella autotrophica]
MLVLIGIIWGFSTSNGFCIGDTVLNTIGLKTWSNGSNGVHFTVFYSLIFIILLFYWDVNIKMISA